MRAAFAASVVLLVAVSLTVMIATMQALHLDALERQEVQARISVMQETQERTDGTVSKLLELQRSRRPHTVASADALPPRLRR